MKLCIGRGTLGIGALAILWACGGEGGTAPASGGAESTEAQQSADLSEATCSGTELTVLNFENWCKVSVSGGKASASASRKVCVTPGTVDLDAKPASKEFELGPDPWLSPVGTVTVKGDSSKTSITVGKTATCVSVCCPFTDGSGCPTTNQCP